jgi:hypothetical protein
MVDKKELDDFITRNEIGEEFNYNAEFQYYHYDKDGKIDGLVAYMKEKDATGIELPRFIHVILDKPIRRSKEAYTFVLDSFKDLKDKGYNNVIAIIPNWKQFMKIFAMRFKFKQVHHDDNYGYWCANLDEVLTRR